MNAIEFPAPTGSAGDCHFLAFVSAILANADPRRRIKPARNGQLRLGEVVIPEELQVADSTLLGLPLIQEGTYKRVGSNVWSRTRFRLVRNESRSCRTPTRRSFQK